jgi:hypothetical protein
MWPDMALTCVDNRPMSPGIAGCLQPLAPRLAPQKRIRWREIASRGLDGEHSPQASARVVGPAGEPHAGTRLLHAVQDIRVGG